MTITGVKLKQTTMALPGSSLPVPAIEVSYMIDGHGPFTDTFKKADFKAADVNAKIQEMAGHVAQVAK